MAEKQKDEITEDEIGQEEITEELVESAEDEVVDIEKHIQELEEALEESNSLKDEYLDDLQRERAAFQNYKKKEAKNKLQEHQITVIRVVKPFLEVIDDLELVLENNPKDDDEAEWVVGIEMIYKKLLRTLEKEGVKPMDPVGPLFDPNLHEAISMEENDKFECDEIIRVVKTGYMMGEQVVRPACVIVAK